MIVSVAIKERDGDLIFRLPKPYRHHDLIEQMRNAGVRPGEQGFLVFMTREQAMDWAKKSGQFLFRDEDDPNYNSTNKLYSEDLW